MPDLKQFTNNGKYLMLAFDHRGSFKKLMNPENPDSVTDDAVIKLKSEIINAVKDQMSGVLIDVNWGLKAYQGREKPFLLPVEKSGYSDQKGERVTELEYTATKLKEMGAGGAKILIYFNPEHESSHLQLATANHILKECKDLDFPYFLEIVTYGDGEDLTLRSLKRFVDVMVVPDVFKLEYPGSKEKCQEISKMVGETPWILLTRGDTYQKFMEELKEAVESGAQGFLAGRALWQEVCSMEGEEKQKFLSETLPKRFKKISDIALSS